MHCKVIVTYFAARRIRLNVRYPYHQQNIQSGAESLQMLREVLASDPGDAALIIVNNRTGFTEGEEFLNGLPHLVEHRPNIGGPIAAFEHAFLRYRERFDYWLFTEDDILITQPYQKYINRFEREKNCGFLAIVGFHDREPFHAHGGVGLTHRRVLDAVIQKHGGLPHPNGMIWDQREMELNGEVAFSAAILGLGYRIAAYGDDTRWTIENGCLPYYEFRRGKVSAQ
jgi:hypothetical protein